MATRKKTNATMTALTSAVPEGGLLDKAVSKITSRKLLVWLTGSALLLTGGLASGDWVAISLVYIGSQAAVDLAVAWKKV
jgi:hypothetical protein